MKRFFLPLLLSASALRAADAPPSWDIVLKAREGAPAVQRAKSDWESLSALGPLSRQRPNPDLDASFTSRTRGDRAGLEGQAAYLHTVELGGKRRARTDAAEARQELAAARLDRAREEATLRSVLGLHRLRQLDDELGAVDEALGAFRGIAGRYRSRARLSPEQETALSLFRMAQVDYDLRRAALLRERRDLESWFTLALGTAPSTFPARPDPWPTADAPATAVLGGARRREAEAELSLARAASSQARGESWPDMKVGPLAALESGRGRDARGLGAAASLPLPLYQRNAGGRALAEAGLARAEILRALSDREWAAELATARASYGEALEALRRVPGPAEMSRAHEATEALFERGLLEPSLVIEAHRQMTDVVRDVNATELEALRALWTVRVLTGRALEDRP